MAKYINGENLTPKNVSTNSEPIKKSTSNVAKQTTVNSVAPRIIAAVPPAQPLPSLLTPPIQQFPAPVPLPPKEDYSYTVSRYR